MTFQTLFYTLMIVLTFTFITSSIMNIDYLYKYTEVLETEKKTAHNLLLMSRDAFKDIRELDDIKERLSIIHLNHDLINKNNEVITQNMKDININLNVKTQSPPDQKL